MSDDLSINHSCIGVIKSCNNVRSGKSIMYRCVEMNFLAVDSKLIISLIIPMDLGCFVSGSDNYDKRQLHQ